MPKLVAWIPLTALALVTLSAVACKGGGRSDDTVRQISDAELSQMVLELGLYGPEYAGFTPDVENTGAVNIDTASEDSFDAADERRDLENYGFLSGYEGYFSGREAGGTIFLGSEVAVFQTPNGAAEHLLESNRETLTQRGKTSDGATLVEAETFEFDAGADTDLGMRGLLRVAQEDGSSTDVWIVAAEYQRGRLLGHVAMYAIGPTDLEKRRLQGRVESLAQVMNQKMASVLAAGAAATDPAAAEYQAE
jgi:hypothetical protein